MDYEDDRIDFFEEDNCEKCEHYETPECLQCLTCKRMNNRTFGRDNFKSAVRTIE